MKRDDHELVMNWFQRRVSDPEEMPFPAPTTGSPLREIIEKRGKPTPAELEARERGLRARELPVPPQKLIDWVGGGDAHVFQTVGLLNFLQLVMYADLRAESRVLEPGCGCGRNARYIAPHLDPERGRYAGFDIAPEGIAWAVETITSIYPNARFTCADIHNTNYNPNGGVDGSEYTFPCDTASFDLVFLPSVFTHLARGAFERYVRETARVLEPGGVLLSWHFLLNDETRTLLGEGRSVLPFESYDEISWVMDAKNPCAAIAFDESWVLHLLEDAGLRTQVVLRGAWAGGRPDGIIDAQDRLLAVKSV